MSALWLVITAGLVVAAFAYGLRRADRTLQQYWRTHGYCPTCDRLTTEQEVGR